MIPDIVYKFQLICLRGTQVLRGNQMWDAVRTGEKLNAPDVKNTSLLYKCVLNLSGNHDLLTTNCKTVTYPWSKKNLVNKYSY